MIGAAGGAVIGALASMKSYRGEDVNGETICGVPVEVLREALTNDECTFQMFGMDITAILAFKQYYMMKGGTLPPTIDRMIEVFEDTIEV